MSCSDCEYRQREMCVLFDDVILSYTDSCFMDSSENDSRISRNDQVNIMSGELEDLMIEYIRTSAILNHLEQYNGTTDELNEVTGKLTILKLRLLEELNR